MVLGNQRLPRLFVERDLDGTRFTLDEREAHYLGHVLRLARGAALVAFNGRGTERRATIESLQRRSAALELADALPPLPEPALELTLVQALPKSDAMDLIVQKATELGARRLLPVLTEFSVVRLDAERRERRLDHWQRIARSACEQCGRHRPPEIEPPAPLAEALGTLHTPAARVVLDPSAELAFDAQPPPQGGIVVAIGPEGGFGTADRRHLADAHFTPVALGPRVLRAETAAIVVCAIAQGLWGDL